MVKKKQIQSSFVSLPLASLCPLDHDSGRCLTCGRYECELDLYAERQQGTKNAFNIFMTLKVDDDEFMVFKIIYWGRALILLLASPTK